MFCQGDSEVLYFAQSHGSAAKKRDARHDAGKRPHQVERCNNVSSEGLAAKTRQLRHDEQDDSDEREIQEVIPVLRGDEAGLGCDIVLLVDLGGVVNVLVESASAAAVQFEFFDAFSQRAEITEEAILFGTREIQPMKRPADHEPVAEAAQNNQHA